MCPPLLCFSLVGRFFDFACGSAQNDIIINKYIFKTSDNINSEAHYCGELISAGENCRFFPCTPPRRLY